MARRGPAPKPPEMRARANVDPIAQTTLPKPPKANQPALPDYLDWPPQTRAWWRDWRDSPLMAEASATDWRFLLDTAVLHARFWSGEMSVAPELRLRVAKFGATPEDRLRLRIRFADEDTPDPKAAPTTRRSARHLVIVEPDAVAGA